MLSYSYYWPEYYIWHACHICMFERLVEIVCLKHLSWTYFRHTCRNCKFDKLATNECLTHSLMIDTRICFRHFQHITLVCSSHFSKKYVSVTCRSFVKTCHIFFHTLSHLNFARHLLGCRLKSQVWSNRLCLDKNNWIWHY